MVGVSCLGGLETDFEPCAFPYRHLTGFRPAMGRIGSVCAINLRENPMNSLLRRASLLFLWAVIFSVLCVATGQTQTLATSSSLDAGVASGGSLASDSAAAPDAPTPLPAASFGDEPTEVPWAAKGHQQPFSRMSIGADVSPLGVGIKSTVILTQYFDARGMFNFFNYDTGKFEIEGFRVDAKFHLASVGA